MIPCFIILSIIVFSSELNSCQQSFQPSGELFTEQEKQRIVSAHSASSDVSLGKAHTSIDSRQYARWGLGNPKLCNFLKGYHYCSFGFEAGLCVPEKCNAKHLMDS